MGKQVLQRGPPGEVCPFRGHFSLSPDFHELWRNMMSTYLLTEVKRQWTMLVLGLVTASVHYSRPW